MTILGSNIRTSACSILSLCLSGCLTVGETGHPAVPVGTLPAGRDLKVQVAGFDAAFTTYDTAYTCGTATGFGGGWYDRRGRYRFGGLGTSLYSATTYVPRREPTAVFRDRATDALERAGCILKAGDPQYRVEVRFEGPFGESGDGWKEAGWLVFTAFTADFDAQGWVAKLRIHDLTTGRLVHSMDFTERDEAIVWGPIPLISPSCSTRTSPGTMMSNCLFALTDRAISDAVAFLSTR